MGQSKPPTAVKLIVGMLSGREALFDMAQEKMTLWWGEIDIQSAVMEFTGTDYYADQMGPALKRKFVSFDKLIDPGGLAAIKHQSNDLEEQIAAGETGKALGVERPINLDPGYLEPSKLVLATTKNYSHRVYIGSGMYAEATLHYHKGSWQAWPYTYPDYAGGQYSAFLNLVRQKLMEQMSSRKENT